MHGYRKFGKSTCVITGFAIKTHLPTRVGILICVEGSDVAAAWLRQRHLAKNDTEVLNIQ